MTHRILIVEDSSIARLSLHSYFDTLDFLVESVATADEAMSSIEHGEYDIVLTDLSLTGANDTSGIAVVSAARARFGSAAILLMAAHFTDDNRTLGVDAGADLVLDKVVDLGELANQIRRVVSSKEQQHTEQTDRLAPTTVVAVMQSDAVERLLAENEHIGLLELVQDGIILECNDAFARMLGHASRRELRGQPISELLANPLDFERCSGKTASLLPSHCEVLMKSRDGEDVWVMTHSLRCMGGHNRPESILATVVNVTDRRLRDDQIARQVKYFQGLIDHASDLITTINRDGMIRFQSPSSRRVLGYEPEQMEGRSLFEIIHPEDIEAAVSAVRRGFEVPAGHQNISIRVRHRDGTWRVLDARSAALAESLNGPTMVINARDISERIQLESELRSGRERYRIFFDEALSGNYICSADGTILDCNPAFCRILGFESIGEALSVNARELHRDIESRESLLRRLQAEGRFDSIDLDLVARDGSQVQVRAHIVAEFDDDGVLARTRGYLLDETARRRAEEQLLHSQKMEAVGRLAGGVAHDFNNLLTTIIGYGQIMQVRTARDDPRRRELKEILRAADRAANLTRQLLAFSRRELVQPRTLDLNSVVSDMEKMLRRLVGEDIDIVAKLSPNRLSVCADAGQLEQVIMNLAVNARDAMPDGGKLMITTSDRLLETQKQAEHEVIPPGRYVILTIIDTGIGMDDATRRRMFDPFFTTKAAGQGTGLGLSTVYGIVEQSHGYVVVRSEPGKGAEFRVYLPQVDGVPEQVEDVPKIMPRADGRESVLVVEDESAVRMLMVEILEDSGYQVSMAASGQEALTMMAEHPGTRIDLVITDVVMPGMNGRELAERIEATQPGIRVLYTSGYTDDAIVRMGLASSVITFLAKPFHSAVLLQKVREVLDSRPALDA